MLFKIGVLIYGYFAGALIQADTGWESSIRLTSGIMAVAMQELLML